MGARADPSGAGDGLRSLTASEEPRASDRQARVKAAEDVPSRGLEDRFDLPVHRPAVTGALLESDRRLLDGGHACVASSRCITSRTRSGSVHSPAGLIAVTVPR